MVNATSEAYPPPTTLMSSEGVYTYPYMPPLVVLTHLVNVYKNGQSVYLPVIFEKLNITQNPNYTFKMGPK